VPGKGAIRTEATTLHRRQSGKYRHSVQVGRPEHGEHDSVWFARHRRHHQQCHHQQISRAEPIEARNEKLQPSDVAAPLQNAAPEQKCRDDEEKRDTGLAKLCEESRGRRLPLAVTKRNRVTAAWWMKAEMPGHPRRPSVGACRFTSTTVRVRPIDGVELPDQISFGNVRPSAKTRSPATTAPTDPAPHSPARVPDR
jgi:hypothetical protein